MQMQKMMRYVVLLALVMVLLGCGNLAAQTGFGVRAGATADPNQFHFGVHYITDPIVDKLTFRPNLEIGIGSNVTVVAANFEFAYRIPIPKTDLSAYVGAGPALNIFRWGSSRNDDTDTGGGFNVLLGLQHNDGLFGEIKVGALDSPEFKFTVGYTFK